MARTERCFLVKKYQNGCVIFFIQNLFFPTVFPLCLSLSALLQKQKNPRHFCRGP